MRFSLVLALALAGLAITATAQKHQRPKAKPSYNEEKSSKGGARAVKEPATRSSAAQELRRVEQSSARASTSRKAESGKAARTNAALKGQKKEVNPPIHFGSSGGSGKGSKGKGGDELRGRLRHKGSHH
jgi:hypothetical protein